MSEEPLIRELETVIGMHRMGGPFTAEWVTGELFRWADFSPKYNREVVYWSIVSALKRYDYGCVRKYVRMWASSPVEPPVWDVSKFVPGDHYHVGKAGKKFDTLDEAKKFINNSGALFGRFYEEFVYARQGE